MFMEKPSKKEYPDYYQVITDPVDMKTIEVNILTDKVSGYPSHPIDFHVIYMQRDLSSMIQLCS